MAIKQISKYNNALAPGIADLLPDWFKEAKAVVSYEKDEIYCLVDRIGTMHLKDLHKLEAAIQEHNDQVYIFISSHQRKVKISLWWSPF